MVKTQIPLFGTAPALTAAAVSPAPRSTSKGEIATIQRSAYGGVISNFGDMEYPLQSSIVLNRSNGQGLKLYRQMMLTDTDMSALFELMFDSVLHNPAVYRPASDRPDHLEHARFLEAAFSRIEHLQNALRHVLYAYAYGFTVLEKVYGVMPSGEFSGAKIWTQLLDKPSHWFTFDMSRRLRFRTFANYSPGDLLPQSKFIVVRFGTNSDAFGAPVLDYCYWPHLLGHKYMKDEAIFMDKWASPTVWAQYDATGDTATDLAARYKALTVAQAIQADQSIATPKGMLLSLLESTRNGSISFAQARTNLFAMISRRVTGQLLATTGADGGSYALAKVHAEGMANKVEMLASFQDSWMSREARELIDINYGPQDVYPSRETLARDPVFKQAHLELEAKMIQNGHRVSISHSDRVLQNVLPHSPEDEARPLGGTIQAQSIAVNPALASGVDLAAHSPALHAHARAKAKEIRGQLETIATTASAQAKPAIRRAVKSIASRVRSKKTAKAVTRAHLFKGLKGYDGAGLGEVFHTMLDRPTGVKFALEAPPPLSYAAKLAYALQMFSIVDSVAKAADDAPEGMSASDFADSLTDPNGAAVDQTHINLFEGTHGTNIASIATGALRQKLAVASYRKEFPYVMIVTEPDARLNHAMLDGFILTADEARYSPLLPPFGFGCRCQAVPIARDTAISMGLTGTTPALGDFLKQQGARPEGSGYVAPSGDRFTPGPAPGFRPAFSDTDTFAQLDALRAKADELSNDDPGAWASLVAWVVWLFGANVLREDPAGEDLNA